jgi:hypothetical protein
MNIYLHVEIAVRELDSKLLLGVLAAAKGHQVLVSSLVEIIIGLKKKSSCSRNFSYKIFNSKSGKNSKTPRDY